MSKPSSCGWPLQLSALQSMRPRKGSVKRDLNGFGLQLALFARPTVRTNRQKVKIFRSPISRCVFTLEDVAAGPCA